MPKITIEVDEADLRSLEQEAGRTGHASAEQFAAHVLHQTARLSLAEASNDLHDILGPDHDAVTAEVRRRQDTPLEESFPAEAFFEQLRNRIAERTGRSSEEVGF